MANPRNVLIGPAQITIDGSDIGLTKDGTMIRRSNEPLDIESDNERGVIKKVSLIERMYITMTMQEATLQNLLLAWSDPTSNLSGYTDNCVGTTVSPPTGTLLMGSGTDAQTYCEEVTEKVIVLVGLSPCCGTRTFTFTRCVQFGDVEYNMQRDAETTISVEFEALKDTTGYFGTVVDSIT